MNKNIELSESMTVLSDKLNDSAWSNKIAVGVLQEVKRKKRIKTGVVSMAMFLFVSITAINWGLGYRNESIQAKNLNQFLELQGDQLVSVVSSEVYDGSEDYTQYNTEYVIENALGKR